MFLDPASGSSANTTPAEASRAATDRKQLDDNMNRFLTLLITQLQNQDPLQPMDANEFTQQLVQFASVEQQIYQNANLEKMLTLQKATQSSNLVNYIGKAVELDGGELALEGGVAAARYVLDAKAAATRIAIADQDGDIVASFTGETAAGPHPFAWDGKDSHGAPLPDGPYRMMVSAVGTDGSAIPVATHVFGTISGVATDTGEPELLVGGRRITLSDIVSITSPASPATKTTTD